MEKRALLPREIIAVMSNSIKSEFLSTRDKFVNQGFTKREVRLEGRETLHVQYKTNLNMIREYFQRQGLTPHLTGGEEELRRILREAYQEWDKIVNDM